MVRDARPSEKPWKISGGLTSGSGNERLETLEQMRQIVGSKVQLISLGDLKQNKKASGRNKDLNDLENLP